MSKDIELKTRENIELQTAVSSNPNVVMKQWGDIWTMAQIFANAEGVGKKAETVAMSIMKGLDLGINPVTAVEQIYMIKGRSSMSAELMRGLIIKLIPGSDLEFVEVTSKKAVMWGYNPNRKRNKELTVEFTIEEAEQAKLIKSDSNWEKYPADMLAARVTSRMKRRHFYELELVSSYVPEELAEADPNIDVAETIKLDTMQGLEANKREEVQAEVVEDEEFNKIQYISYLVGELDLKMDDIDKWVSVATDSEFKAFTDIPDEKLSEWKENQTIERAFNL